MKNNDTGRVHYLCFYSESEVEDKLVAYPSVISKIDYIVEVVKRLGRNVVIVSIAPSKRGLFSGFCKEIDKKEKHIYLPSYTPSNEFLKKTFFLFHSCTVLLYLLKNVKRNDKVVVYHSLYNRLWMKIYSALNRKNVILQIEDVFSELTNDAKRFSKGERRLFHKVRKCLCINDILYEELKDVQRKAVSYGSYHLPPKFETLSHEKIRVVYAGVIEQERKAAYLAAETIRFLPEQYEVHILGFGTHKDIQELAACICRINKIMGRQAVFYHGKKTGEDYWRFLQGCDIALSTHAYDENSMSSANYTFPSKVLTYMANDLPVVAQRIDVLQKSQISDNLYFYDQPQPEQIAGAVMRAENAKKLNGRQRIKELDQNFMISMKVLLEE